MVSYIVFLIVANVINVFLRNKILVVLGKYDSKKVK